MKINDAIKEQWEKDFFENHQSAGNIRDKLKEEYGMNPSNVSMNLKLCKFLRKEKKGWIQKTRFGLKNVKSDTKLNSDLNQRVRDSKLKSACKTNYDAGEYWDAVFNALRHLEVRVRRKSSLSATDVGADLIEKAFKPNVGILKVPTCATPGEEDGFKQILKGMMLFHRNAKGHREEFIDKEFALKIIGYIDYLLIIIDSGERR